MVQNALLVHYHFASLFYIVAIFNNMLGCNLFSSSLPEQNARLNTTTAGPCTTRGIGSRVAKARS